MDRAAVFREKVVATLTYWRNRTRNLDDREIVQLDQERQNLLQAMHFGLALPQAWETVATIAIQAIPLINRRMYRLEWLPVLQRLLDQAPTEQVLLRIHLLIQYGRMQRLQRQLDTAIETHQFAHQLTAEFGDAQVEALVTYNLGRDYLDRRNYSAAERFSQQTLELLEQVDDQELMAKTYITLGHIYRERGALERSTAYHTRALAINRASGDKTQLARSLIEVATDLRAESQPGVAVTYYQEALEVLAMTANDLDKTVIHLNIGGAYFEMENWFLAEKALRAVDLDYLRQSGNIYYQAIVTVSLGNVLMKQERLTEAEATLRLSVKLWYQVDDNLNLANAVGTLGEVLAALGSKEAEEHLKKALALLIEFGDEPRAENLRKLFQGQLKKLLQSRY